MPSWLTTELIIGIVTGLLIPALTTYVSWDRNGRIGGWWGLVQAYFGLLPSILDRFLPKAIQDGTYKASPELRAAVEKKPIFGAHERKALDVVLQPFDEADALEIESKVLACAGKAKAE